ncbi:MAG: PAS domain-containing protein [Candidatus Lokiarchaeota archaeon]
MNGDKFDYFAIFDEFPISILILDLKGIIKYCNQSVVTLLNLTFDEIIGFHFSKLPIFPNGNKDVATSLFQKVIKEGVLKPQEFKLKGKNGLIKWIIIVAAKIRVNENFFIQLIARDISKEKIIKRRLQESEQKFRKIAEQALMGIAIIQDDEIKYINKHFADLIRYDIKEINNWEPGFYKNIIHSEDRDVTIKRSKNLQI